MVVGEEMEVKPTEILTLGEIKKYRRQVI